MRRRILFLGLALATLGFAQGKKGGGGGNYGDFPMTPDTVSRLDQFSQILKLDKDEKKQVKTIMDDGQKEAIPVRDQMEKDRLALAQAAAGGKQDEIGAASKTYAADETQMTGIELNAFAKIYKLLDNEQQSKTAQVFIMFPGIFKNKNWNDSQTR
jgi:Spy/CpxP family protein refolding chaperone